MPAIDPATLITAQLARNEELTQAAIDAANEAMTVAQGYAGAGTPFQAETPELRGTPPVFSPNSDLSVDFKNAYLEAFNDFNPKVLEAVTDYMARFFPAALVTVCSDWIQNAILYGGTGIPAAIEDAIWQRERAREVLDARRLEAEAANQFATRGFVIPPGALAARMLQVQTESAARSATISRDTAIKNVEIEIQNIRFAVEQGMRVRTAIIGGVAGYVAAWMKPADASVEYAKALAQAKDRLWNEAANYYRAMIDEARLGLEAQNITARSTDARVALDVQAFTSHINTQASTATAVAGVIGNAAAGALNASSGIAQTVTSLIGAAT